jgi:hypothetical protein
MSLNHESTAELYAEYIGEAADGARCASYKLLWQLWLTVHRKLNKLEECDR